MLRSANRSVGMLSLVLTMTLFCGGGCISRWTTPTLNRPTSSPTETAQSIHSPTANQPDAAVTGAGNLTSQLGLRDIAGVKIEQILPVGLASLLGLWLMIQSVMHKRTLKTHNQTVQLLAGLCHQQAAITGDALWASPPKPENHIDPDGGPIGFVPHDLTGGIEDLRTKRS
jgi:hypothetical protein